MSQNPIQVEVRGKQIVKDPINKLIVQGEFEGETIVFRLERYVGGKDLLADGVTYEMNGVNSNGQSAVNLLTKGTTSDPSKFTLTWVVGQQFTAANYEMRIWISAIKSVNNQVVFRWSTYPARIYIHEGFILSDYVSVTDQLLLDLGSYLSQAQASAAAAGNSAQQAKTSETNAKNSATTAGGSATAAASSATASANSATASEKSATASAASAKESSQYATNSANSATASAKSASDSAASATASKNSATDSANSASASKASETAAKASETAAAKSESNAATSASTASQKSDDARQSAIESADSATEALISQQQAKYSADNSEASAAAALESERNSKQSEETILANIDRAETSASLANQSASDAEDAARRAKDSEYQAVQSAAESESSAIDARNSADDAYQIIQDAIATFGNDVLLQMIIMRDPTTGELDTAQNIVNNLFALNSDALTAFEYQQLGLTAEEYAAYNITAYEYITDGKRILTGSSGGSGGGDSSYLEPRVVSLEGRASALESQVGDVASTLLIQSGDIQVNRIAIDGTNQRLDGALADIRAIKDVLQIQ